MLADTSLLIEVFLSIDRRTAWYDIPVTNEQCRLGIREYSFSHKTINKNNLFTLKVCVRAFMLIMFLLKLKNKHCHHRLTVVLSESQ